jgi:hypothetical protein
MDKEHIRLYILAISNWLMGTINHVASSSWSHATKVQRGKKTRSNGIGEGAPD